MPSVYACDKCRQSKTVIFKAKAVLSDESPYDIKVVFVKATEKQRLDIRGAIRKIELQIGKKVKSYKGTLTYTKCGCVVDCTKAML